jgi:choline dehydrogenase-like flavoprotein
LLLLSESDRYPDGLANSSGAVGRYFMDHPGIRLSGVVDRPGNPNPIGFHTAESHQFYDRDEPFPASFKIEFWNSNPLALPDVALRGGDRNIHGDLRDVVEGDAWGDDLLERIEGELGEHRMFLRATTEPLPQWENAITLDRSTTDAHGNPVPDVSLALSDRSRRTLEHARGIQQEIMAELDATEVSGQDPSRPAYGAHHMGTTRMGHHADESVVDARLRTHDLENLTVASSSVFVTAGALNPTLTIAALALKAADHIDEDL